jgi:hypothetical protein
MGSYKGSAIYTLESKDFASGGRPVIRVSDLAKGRAVKGFLLRLDATITQPGSGSVAIKGKDLKRIFNSVVIGKRTRATGMLLRALTRRTTRSPTPSSSTTRRSNFSGTRRSRSGVPPSPGLFACRRSTSAPTPAFSPPSR